MTAQEPRQIAIISARDGYGGFLAAIRARVTELQLTHTQIDVEADWPAGYAGKILAPIPFKTLGRTSLGPMLDVLGLKLVLVEDPGAMARAAESRVKRVRPCRCARPLKPLVANAPEVRSLVAKEMHKLLSRNGRKGAAKSAEARRKRKVRIPKWKRRSMARKAARARWRKANAAPLAGALA